VHVGAGRLTVSALVPDLIRGACSVSIAVLLGAYPGSTLAHASVALFFTACSVLVVNSFVDTFTACDWNTLVEFLVDCLTSGASAAGDALLDARFWLNVTTGQTATTSTLLVHLTGRT
jgi:hypothetical protein